MKRLGQQALTSAATAFEKWEAGGVEEVAAAIGHLHLRVFAAVMHNAEKGEQLRPSAVALAVRASRSVARGSVWTRRSHGWSASLGARVLEGE